MSDPDPRRPEAAPDGEPAFEALLPVRLPYPVLARRGLERLAEAPIRIDQPLLKGRVEVPRLAVRSADGRLELVAGLRGRFRPRLLDAEATVRLCGVPVLEPGGRLRVDDLDVVAEEAGSPLLRGLLAVARPALRDALQRALRVDLAERLERLRSRADARLEALEVAPGVRLRGGLERLELRDLRVEEDALVVVARVRGRAQVELHDDPGLPSPEGPA